MKSWFGKTMTAARSVNEIQNAAKPAAIGHADVDNAPCAHPASFHDWHWAMQFDHGAISRVDDASVGNPRIAPEV